MPSIYTHYKFGEDVYSKLDNKTKGLIEDSRDCYNLFNQAFDTLYYYNFLSFKKGKKIRNFAHYAHRNNTNLFFENLINYIKDNKLENNSDVMTLLYGFLNHYALDTTMHPYLNYKTGRYNRLDKNTKKYKGNHSKCEIMIDRYMYEKNNKGNWFNYKLYKDIIKPINFSNALKETINYVLHDTFNQSNMGNIFEVSNKQSIIIYKVLMKDKYGIKKLGYKILDLFTPFKDSLYSSYSHHVDVASKELLNTDNLPWLNPVDKETFYEKSFFNLYEDALYYAIDLIKLANLVIKNEANINELLNLLGNKNYETGLNIEDKRILQYFEY